jgi:hypothetical protein
VQIAHWQADATITIENDRLELERVASNTWVPFQAQEIVN